MGDQKARIVLTGEDKTRAAFDSARRNLDGLTSGVAKVNSLMAGLGAGASLAGLTAFVKRSIDAADNINDLSQKIGVSVEALAGYKLAAEQSGTSLEAIGTASRFLAKNIAEGDKTLKALGITSTDVNGAMEQLADVFAALPDGAQKTAIAMKLMGKSGADMIPFLNGGGAAVREMVAEGQRLYPVTTEMARSADQFNDAMARFKVGAEGAGIALGNVLLPYLQKTIDTVSQAIGLWRQFNVGDFVRAGVAPTQQAGAALKTLRAEIKELEDKNAAIPAGKFPALRAGNDERLATLKRMKAAYEELQRSEALAIGAPFANYKTAKTPPPSLPKGLFDAGGSRKGGAKAKLDELDPFGPQRRAALEAQARETQAFLDEQQESINDLNSAMAQDASRAADDYASKLAALVSDTTLAKTEALQANIDLLNRAFFDGDIGAEQYGEAMAKLTTSTEKLADAAKDSNDIARELGLTFSSAFEDAVVGGKKFSDVLRGLNDDLVRLTIRKSVTEPLAEGFSGLLKGFDFGSLFGGFRAAGGNVAPGKFYVVGERGPELLAPASAGRVYPMSGGAAGGVIIQMTVVTQDASSFSRSKGQIQADLAFAMQGARRFT